MPCNVIESMGELSALINLPLTYNLYTHCSYAPLRCAFRLSLSRVLIAQFQLKTMRTATATARASGCPVGRGFVYAIALFNWISGNKWEAKGIHPTEPKPNPTKPTAKQRQKFTSAINFGMWVARFFGLFHFTLVFLLLAAGPRARCQFAFCQPLLFSINLAINQRL